MAAQEQIDGLLRRVESRAIAREELGAIVRGVFGTVAIVAGIVGLLLAVMIGAIVFAIIMNIWAS
jgi:heme O synthase-like polyprenyltransferase